MPCPAWYCRAISYRHGTLTFETTHCRHRSTSPTPGQRCADWTTRRTRAHARIPTSSPWVGRDFARPHLPNSKSAQTRGKAILSETQRSRDPRKDLPCNIDRQILTQRKNSYDPFKLQTCPVSRSERPPLQHASQLPLGTPSEHFRWLRMNWYLEDEKLESPCQVTKNKSPRPRSFHSVWFPWLKRPGTSWAAMSQVSMLLSRCHKRMSLKKWYLAWHVCLVFQPSMRFNDLDCHVNKPNPCESCHSKILWGLSVQQVSAAKGSIATRTRTWKKPAT